MKENSVELFGNLLSIPVKIVNVPIKVVEKLIWAEGDEDCILSKPLDTLANEFKKIDD